MQEQIEQSSKEFLERMAIIEAQKQVDLIKHDFKIMELRFERETAKLIHEQILERGRIQRAEERKIFAEKMHERRKNFI